MDELLERLKKSFAARGLDLVVVSGFDPDDKPNHKNTHEDGYIDRRSAEDIDKGFEDAAEMCDACKVYNDKMFVADIASELVLHASDALDNRRLAVGDYLLEQAGRMLDFARSLEVPGE